MTEPAPATELPVWLEIDAGGLDTEVKLDYVDWKVFWGGTHIGLMYMRVDDDVFVVRTIRGTSNPFKKASEAITWLKNKHLEENP